MCKNQYKTTSLPSSFPFGRAGVGFNEVIRLMMREKSPATVVVLLDKLGGNEVGLSPRITRINTKNLFVIIREISGQMWMKNALSSFVGIDRKNGRRNFATKYFSKNEFNKLKINN